MGIKFNDRWQSNLGLLILLFLITITISCSYVNSEHTFYAGDFAPVYYHNAVQLVVRAWRQSPAEAIIEIWQSLGQDHNQLFTIPLLPLALLFGDSRTSYIVSVAVVYLLPWSLVMGAIASRLLLLGNPKIIFWLTTFITILLPMTWLPALRGYPDVGGAVVIGIAYLLIISPKKSQGLSPESLSLPLLQSSSPPIFNRISWRRLITLGFCLGLAMLFRRHFVYADLALLGGAAVEEIGLIFINQKQVIRGILNLGGRIAVVGAIALLTIMIPAREFTTRALTTDFRGLYASWSLTFTDIFTYYLNFYGWLTWILVIIGFILGFILVTLPFQRGVFIISTGIISLVNLLVILRYDSLQYTLHFTPFIVLGLITLLVTSYRKFTNKLRLITIVSGVYLGINFLFMLTGLGKFNLPLRSIFAANYPPQVRQDYQQIQKLTNYLRQVAAKKEPIYVISSSAMDLLSRDVLVNAETTFYGKEKTILNFLSPQSFDSSSSYPLEDLLQSKYVVVTEPMQYRFSVEHHDVARVAYEVFAKNWEFSQDFRRLPETFRLENGSVVSIYQRTRPTTISIAIKTLGKMQQEIKERPGGQPDWISIGQQFPLTIQQQSSMVYQINTQAGYRNRLPTTALIYLQPLPSIVQVKGLIKFPDQQCLGVSLKLSIYNQQGQRITTTETLKTPQFPPVFFLSSTTKQGDYLVWQVISSDDRELIDHCGVEISNLTLGATP